MSEAERVENLRTLAEFDRLEQSVTIASGWLMSAAKNACVEASAKMQGDSLAVERDTRGGCVRDPVIPKLPER